ncbi:MAG: LPS export ABC transporter periplasmic protein LptC [Xanthobacteraceae bacterium]|nr:LPS export ABC transporter periplasmic protein LptC [Xanthobacteraceae bacterium]
MYSAQSPAYLADLEARFAAAARHSRLVRVLRIAVPAAVALALAAILLVSIFNPFRVLMPDLPIDIDNLVVSGTKITMESPHMSGFSPDQRPYEVSARTATQDLTNPNSVELATIRARVTMEDKSTVTMDAATGVFDTKAQLLDLKKDILLRSSTGYEARLTRALIDINKGLVTSDEPVAVKLLNGTLDSDRLRIIDKGEVVRFEGNVRMDLVMEQPNAAASPSQRGESGGDAPLNPSQDPQPLPASSRRSPGTKHGTAR